jgi:hypothetical protein
MEALSAVSAPPAGKKKLVIENGALQPKPPAKSASAAVAGAAAAKSSPKKAVHRSDANDDSHAKNAPDFSAFMPQVNGFGGFAGGMVAAPGFDGVGVRASFDAAMPPSNFNLDGDSFWTSPPKQVPGKR